MIAVLLLVVGLGLLVLAGNLVVESSSRLGRRFGLSPTVVGLTIVAAGTSAPELAVTVEAVRRGDTDLAIGNVVGSNIANVLLVLGISAAIGAIVVASRVVRADIPIMIGSSLLLVMLVLDGELGRIDGVIMAVALVAFVIFTLRASTDSPTPSPDTASSAGPRHHPARSVAELIGGIVLLAVAARLVVGGAEEIAVSLGVPQLIVGLTIVALGTSAPEIVTSVVAARRGHRDIAVGNAVGSNIANILLVLGVAGVIARDPIPVSNQVLTLDLPIMVAVAVACLPMFAWNFRLDRWEGGLFMAYYAAYLTFLVLDGTGHPARNPFAVVMVGFVLPLTVVTVATIAHRSREPDLGTSRQP